MPKKNFELNEQMLPVIEEIGGNMPGGFFIYEAEGDGRIIYANDAVFEIFGCRNREEFVQLTGFTFSGMVHPDDREEILSSITEQIAVNRDKIDHIEYRIVKRDGSIRLVDDYGHYTETEAYGGVFYVFISDITEIARIRREKEEARMASEAKSAFLFNMSHDIRTPMNAIIGYTALAKRSNKDPETDAYLSKIGVSGACLLDLINDVLEMSRIDSGAVSAENEDTDLFSVIDGIDVLFGTQMKEKGLAYISDRSGVTDRYVSCDRKKLGRILINVVSNAFKFTPAGGTVTLTVTETDCGCGRPLYEFRVRDTGIGMSKEFAEKVFTAFERERTSTDSGLKGAGLGAAITKGFVGLMGGTIDLTTAPGEGTEFVISFRFEKVCPPVETDGGGSCESADFTGKRVLLVEDNEINREIAEYLLCEIGFTFECAENGRIALDMVSRSAPGYYDLILMDIQMPVMDGYEATRRIRALRDPALSGIPIVAVTANAFKEDRDAAKEAGMQAHIAKPLSAEDFINTITTVLNGN